MTVRFLGRRRELHFEQHALVGAGVAMTVTFGVAFVVAIAYVTSIAY